MSYENFRTGFNKPAIFSAQTYGTKTTVEIDHSDLDLNEVMEAFQTLIIGMGYSNDSLKHWVLEKADGYNEEDRETILFNEEETKVMNDYLANLPADYDNNLPKNDFEYNDYGMRVNKTKK